MIIGLALAVVGCVDLDFDLGRARRGRSMGQPTLPDNSAGFSGNPGCSGHLDRTEKPSALVGSFAGHRGIVRGMFCGMDLDT